MWQRFQRWFRSGWSGWWTRVLAITIGGLTIYAFTEWDLAQYVPLGLGLLFAVALSAFLGGLWPGLLSTLIIVVPLKLFFDGHVAVSGIPVGPPSLLRSFPIVFGFTGAIVSVFFEALHRSRRASNAVRRELTATLANTGDAIVTTNALGRIEYLNRAAAVLLQHEPADIVGQPFESVVKIHDTTNGTTDNSPAVSLFDQVLSSGHTVHMGNHQVLVRDDGKQLAIEATAAPVRDLAGQLVSVVMTIRDCTEQRQVENMLRERLALQARFERTAAIVPGCIYEFRTGADGREQLSYASRGFKEIFGVDPALFADDAAGFRAMLAPDDAANVLELTEAAARELTPVYIEQRMLTPHRGLRWVSVSAAPMRQADGSILWHGIFADVTERKRAEERLRASQLQLRAALDAGAMGIVTANMESGIVEMDATARRLWGLDPMLDQITAEDLSLMIHPDDRHAATAEYGQMQIATQLYNHEYRLLVEGKERWVACRGRVYVDEVTGSLVGVGVVMDITQHRRIEEQRLHAQKLEALSVLAGGIAHDFNNLLLAISGNAKLLLADLPDREAARSVREIDKAALRAAELVRRILSFSSVPDPSQVGQPPVALRPILDEVLGLARAVLPTSVIINANIADTLPEIVADGPQVHQALINLLTNAADATVAAGGDAINLEVAAVDVDESLRQALPEVQQGRYVCVTVSDKGRGIDPAVVSRIFDPFFTTKPIGRGTGLGLAIVYGIMRSIDGAVTVRSIPGHGAAFSLYFPAQQGVAVVATPETEAPTLIRCAHILYVDDEESLTFLMTRTLERMGHRVTACVSPEVALEKFMANADDFDLVVSDMAMPGLSGIELAERMLALRPQLPFIITSGFIDATDVERAHAVGVRRMIMKPNTVDDLSVTLAAILREHHIAPSA